MNTHLNNINLIENRNIELTIFLHDICLYFYCSSVYVIEGKLLEEATYMYSDDPGAHGTGIQKYVLYIWDHMVAGLSQSTVASYNHYSKTEYTSQVCLLYASALRIAVLMCYQRTLYTNKLVHSVDENLNKTKKKTHLNITIIKKSMLWWSNF